MANWKAGLIAGSAALLAIYSGGLLYEGFISDRYSGFLTYPFVDKPAAERAYDRLAPSTPFPVRDAAAWRLVQADPANPESWNAVAYSDWLEHGQRLSPKGMTALDHSYAVSFFDRPAAVWRVHFALENWADLTPEVRKDAVAEAKVVLADPKLGPQLRDALSGVSAPEGRLAVVMLLAQAKR